MKIESTGITVIGTVAELRRIADALVLNNAGLSERIRLSLLKRDDEGYADDEYTELPDTYELRQNFHTRRDTEAVLKVIRALCLVEDN